MIGILKRTIYYIINKGTVYIPLLIDNGSTYIVVIKAFYMPKLPYKLLLELAFKKRNVIDLVLSVLRLLREDIRGVMDFMELVEL